MATILLGMTTLLKVTNSSEVTVFLAKVTCSIKSTFVKGVYTKSINVRVAKSTDIRDLWVGYALLRLFILRVEI